jgi:MYXO-CTERM domain-containing protein
MATRLASVLTVLVLGGLLVPIGALADGDPASDVLLGENVFYPYTPPVPGSVQKTLNTETAGAKRAGFPIKVALIASPVDLGVIPALFGKPQMYADFLEREISFEGPQPLLVVMAAGYGTQGFTAKLAAGALRLPAGKTSTDLAQAAIVAVAKLASASGHPINGVPGVPGTSGSGGGGSSSTPIVIGLAAAAVLVAGALIALRRRQAVRPAR